MSALEPVVVRAMQPEEAGLVRAIARRSFPPQEMLLFGFSEHNLVATLEARPVGGVVLRTFAIPGGRKGGTVVWLFVDPDARRQGVGQALVQAALALFDEQGCTDVFASVNGDNTPSARRWANAGMSILSPGMYIARYGIAGALAVLYHTSHFVDAGYFLWARPPADAPDSPWLQWWGVALMNILLLALALWRQNGFRTVSLMAIGLCALAALTFLGARTLAMLAAAKVQGLSVRYRAWESGFPPGVAIAALFGGYYANPGSLYPVGNDWSHHNLLPRLGPMALAGAASTLLLLVAARAWGPTGWTGASAPLWFPIANWVGISLAVLDILLPIFPFESNNGRRIWDWKRWVWIALALATVGVFFL